VRWDIEKLRSEPEMTISRTNPFTDNAREAPAFLLVLADGNEQAVLQQVNAFRAEV
jgi:hypothetical protein